jgi:WD40 repeat protein
MLTVVRWGRRRPFLAAAIALAAVAWGTIPVLVVGHSNRLATEVANRRIAETEAEGAERKAEEQDFNARLERVRQRRVEPDSGWGDESLADLRELAAKRPASDVFPELRSEAAAALAAVDLRPVRTLAEGFSAYAPAFSPDGTTLALCGWSWEPATRRGRVRLIEPASGRAARELTFPIDPAWSLREGVRDGCRSVAFSPDGRWLVVGTRGGQLARWDLTADTPVQVTWDAHTGDRPNLRRVAVHTLAFAADGGMLYSTSANGTRAWDVRHRWAPIGERMDYYMPVGAPVLDGPFPVHGSGWELHRFNPSKGETVALGTQLSETFTVTRDGLLVMGLVTTDGLLSLVAAEPGARAWPLRFPEMRDETPFVTHLGFSPDAALLATSEEHERRIKLWDTASGQLLSDRGVSGGSGRFDFSADGSLLAVTESERTVLYQVTGRVRETLAVGPRHRTERFAAQPDGRALAVLSADPGRNLELSTWDISARLPVRTSRRDVGYPVHRIRTAAFALTGMGFAFNTDRSAPGVRVEFSDGTAVTGEDVSDLRFAPDGRLWAADAHRIRIWTLPGWAEECPLENDAAARSSGMVFRAVAPGRRVSAVGRRDGRVFLLPANGSTAPPVTAFDSAVTSLTLSADERRIFVGGERGELGVLGSDGRVVTVIRDAHRDAVTAVAAGPGGWIVTGSADRTVKLWDTGLKPILTLRVGGGVRQAALSADGRLLTYLVTGERGVRRWRLDHLAAALADLGLPPGWPVTPLPATAVGRTP